MGAHIPSESRVNQGGLTRSCAQRLFNSASTERLPISTMGLSMNRFSNSCSFVLNGSLSSINAVCLSPEYSRTRRSSLDGLGSKWTSLRIPPSDPAGWFENLSPRPYECALFQLNVAHPLAISGCSRNFMYCSPFESNIARNTLTIRICL